MLKLDIVLLVKVLSHTDHCTVSEFEFVGPRVVLVCHSINLVRNGIMRCNDNFPRIVNIWGIELLKNLTWFLAVIIPLTELLPNSFFCYELGAGINIHKDTIVALFGGYFKTRPFSALILGWQPMNCLLIWSKEELGESTHLLVALLSQSMLYDNIEILQDFAHLHTSLIRKVVKVNLTICFKYNCVFSSLSCSLDG